MIKKRGNNMKALTIKEPWATLIISGYKKYEFRSWKTNYRGEIFIHASGKELAKEYLTNEYVISLIKNLCLPTQTYLLSLLKS